MKKVTVFLGIVFFLISQAIPVIGAEPLNQPPIKQTPTTAPSPQTSQLPMQQRTPIKILNPNPYMRAFLVKPEAAYEAMINDINSIYNKAEIVKVDLTVMRINYETILGIVKACSEKIYTTQEQQSAGCLPNDTLQQCSDKLMAQCISMSGVHNIAQGAKSQLAENQGRMNDIINRSKDVLNNLKVFELIFQQY